MLCACGKAKSARARMCRSCYDMLRTIRADEAAEARRSYCACGREKGPAYEMCAECRNELNRIRFKRTRVDHDVCPECGGVKQKRSSVCWNCHIKHQSERWTRIWSERKKEPGLPGTR